jgi:glycosyltransferase involved in cell wall biosynthesis
MENTSSPWVSFCMSTYKRPQFLEKQIKTLQNQTFSNFEVIISDNDPDSVAKEIVEKYKDPRFKYFNNGANLGMIKSFNNSIEKAKGEYIVMITDDDPVYPDMLQILYDLQLEFPGFGLYLGGCDWFCTSHEVGKLYGLKIGTNSCLSSEYDLNYRQTYTSDQFLNKLFNFGIFPHYLWSTAIVKREILNKNYGIPDYGTPFLGDYAYIATMGSHSGCVVINRSLGCQTLHKENFGRNQNEQILTAAKCFPEYIDQKARHLKQWPGIQKKMLRFTGLWVISHLSFLNSYYKQIHQRDSSLKSAEREVFKVPYIKKYKFKYSLKKHFPFIHNSLVKIKQRMRK